MAVPPASSAGAETQEDDEDWSWIAYDDPDEREAETWWESFQRRR